MKIQLPNGKKIVLEEHVAIEEKLSIVEKLVEEWNPILIKNWNSNSVRFFIDGLANYLVWHKEVEDVGTEDKEILSVKKVELMSGKRKSITIPFSSLSAPQKELLFGEVLNNE